MMSKEAKFILHLLRQCRNFQSFAGASFAYGQGYIDATFAAANAMAYAFYGRPIDRVRFLGD